MPKKKSGADVLSFFEMCVRMCVSERGGEGELGMQEPSPVFDSSKSLALHLSVGELTALSTGNSSYSKLQTRPPASRTCSDHR